MFSRDYKKKHGIFDTPEDVADFIIKRISVKKNLKILEPGCGSGIFVDLLADKLRNIGLKKRDIFSKVIYCFDQQKGSIKRIREKYKISGENYNIRRSNFFSNTFFDEQRFDYIIGNPPYGAKLTSDDLDYIKKNPEIFPLKSNESSVLFICKAIHLLKEGGKLIFVLPATLLRVKAYAELRKFLKEETFLNLLVNLEKKFKGVGYETIILEATKKSPKIDIPKKITLINNLPDLKKKSYDVTFLAYREFLKREIFPLYLDNDLIKLVKKIKKNTIKLSEIARMPRGLNVNVTDRKNIVYEKIKKSEQILCGKNVKKYYINTEKPRYFLLYSNFRNKIKEIKQKKILVQNLAYKIVASLDEEGFLTNSTVNNLILETNDYYYEYILAILNSIVMIFYLQNTITNKARLNIHLDEAYLGKIPIKRIPKRKQVKIVRLVRRLQDNIKNKPRSQTIRNELEVSIRKLYDLKLNINLDQYIIKGKANI